LITRACIVVFVCGVAGLIISSVAGNNNGLVLTIGGVIVVAAVVLMTVNTVTVHERIDAFDDAAAEQLEAHITRLVAQGADETDVRALVRDARQGRRR
jgi:cell division protein FtsW (lipid II flippase)